jgi:hypothetical protein
MPQRGRPKKQKEIVPFMEQADYAKLVKDFDQERTLQMTELYKDLAKMKDKVNYALRHVGQIDECGTIAEAAFKAGRVYGPLDEVNDQLETMLDNMYENNDFDHWEDINN